MASFEELVHSRMRRCASHHGDTIAIRGEFCKTVEDLRAEWVARSVASTDNDFERMIYREGGERLFRESGDCSGNSVVGHRVWFKMKYFDQEAFVKFLAGSLVDSFPDVEEQHAFGFNRKFFRHSGLMVEKLGQHDYDQIMFLLGRYLPTTGMDLSPFSDFGSIEKELSDFSRDIVKIITNCYCLTCEQRDE